MHANFSDGPLWLERVRLWLGKIGSAVRFSQLRMAREARDSRGSFVSSGSFSHQYFDSPDVTHTNPL